VKQVSRCRVSGFQSPRRDRCDSFSLHYVTLTMVQYVFPMDETFPEQLLLKICSSYAYTAVTDAVAKVAKKFASTCSII